MANDLKTEIQAFANLIRARFGPGVTVVQATMADGSERYTRRYPADPAVDSHETFDYGRRHA